jgi:hypothetical protein
MQTRNSQSRTDSDSEPDDPSTAPPRWRARGKSRAASDDAKPSMALTAGVGVGQVIHCASIQTGFNCTASRREWSGRRVAARRRFS